LTEPEDWKNAKEEVIRREGGGLSDTSAEAKTEEEEG